MSKEITIAKMSGGGAARPPPSASMGKLSLEDDNARKSNANGPSGKQGLERSAVTVACPNPNVHGCITDTITESYNL